MLKKKMGRAGREKPLDLICRVEGAVTHAGTTWTVFPTVEQGAKARLRPGFPDKCLLII